MKISLLGKMFGLMLGVMFTLSASVSAMTFSQPVELGKMGGLPTGGFWIHGASYNNGTSYRNGSFDKEWNDKLYEKGIARFGEGDKGLWVYYDCSAQKGGSVTYLLQQVKIVV